MNDGQPQRAQLAADAAAQREKVFEHQTERNFVLGKFLFTDISYAVLLLVFFQLVDDVAAAGFLLAVGIAAGGFGLFSGFV
jgi:hypothetical protein